MTSAEHARSIQGQGKEMEEPHEIIGMAGLGKDSLHPISKPKNLRSKIEFFFKNPQK